jgi:integrase
MPADAAREDVAVQRRGSGPATPACLHAMGQQIAHALFYKAPLRLLPALRARHVLLEAVAMADRGRRRQPPASSQELDIARIGLTWQQALALVVSHLQHLVESGDLTQRTVQKMAAEMASLTLYMADGLHRPLVADVRTADVARWIDSALGGRRHNGQPPSATTRRLRRSAARLLFRVLRHLDLHAGDPTLDIGVPGGGVTSTTVPLSDEDLHILRYACVIEAGDTRLPSVLALSEAGGTTDELWRVRIRDCDLADGTVGFRGNKHRIARRNPLSAWGARQLRNRVEALRRSGADDDTLVVYAGAAAEASESPGVSAARAVRRLLELADLAHEPGIRPGSIPAAFGKRVWERHRDIALVAQALGCRSLDAAARIIDVDVRASRQDCDASLRECVLAEQSFVYQRGKRRPHRHARKAANATPRPSRPSSTTPGRLIRCDEADVV